MAQTQERVGAPPVVGSVRRPLRLAARGSVRPRRLAGLVRGESHLLAPAVSRRHSAGSIDVDVRHLEIVGNTVREVDLRI